MSPNIKKRFDELLAQGQSLPVIGGTPRCVPAGEWKLWFVSALNLISYAFGENSVPFRALSKYDNKLGVIPDEKDGAVGVFAAAKKDAEAGIVGGLERQVAGELFAGFIVSAKEALSSGNKDVAAVLACAALEDTLKRFAVLNGLNVDGKPMDSVIGALKSAGLISGAQKGLLDAMPKIRNAAMHADWAKVSEPDVASVIGFTEQFLLMNLS